MNEASGCEGSKFSVSPRSSFSSFVNSAEGGSLIGGQLNWSLPEVTRGRLDGQRQYRVAYLTMRLSGGSERLGELGRDYPRFHGPRVRGRVVIELNAGESAGSTEDFATEGVTRVRFPLWVRPTTPKGGSP